MGDSLAFRLKFLAIWNLKSAANTDAISHWGDVRSPPCGHEGSGGLLDIELECVA